MGKYRQQRSTIHRIRLYTTVASSPKNQTKRIHKQRRFAHKPSTANNKINRQQQQQFHQYHTSSPLIADSPSPSPSGTAISSATTKPPTLQLPMQMLQQQQFTITSIWAVACPNSKLFNLYKALKGSFSGCNP
ncbi:hypothetical protein EVAR_72166_1 [Eumeta japonica]|uniref:Uncharacterized protein n=1 Tax=Eumeta variegata TaxID=151549 RepID=A0A4C1SR64_EUMVA|nr:hypothetical protein EVAR_72166_1 [Eumeta japonica]